MMETHGSPTLLLFLLCVAISIARGRSRFIPDVFLKPEPPGAGRTPHVSKTPPPELAPGISPEPAGAGRTPPPELSRGISPTPEPVEGRLAPDISRVRAAAPLPLRSHSFSFEGIEAMLSNSPVKSVDMPVKKIDGPSAAELDDDIGESLDEYTYENLE